MNLARTIDWLALIGACLALMRAVLLGYRAATNPFLWFFVGTTVFINLGSIRDAAFGTHFDPAVEFNFHLLELVHLGTVAAAYWLATRIQKRSKKPPLRDTSTSAGVLDPRKFVLVLAATALIKFYTGNPLAPFEEDISNYIRTFSLMSVASGCLAIAVFEEHRGRMAPIQWVFIGATTIAVVALWTFDQSRTPVVYGLFCLFVYLLWGTNSFRSIGSRLLLACALPVAVIGALMVGGAVKAFSLVVSFDAPADQAIEFGESHIREVGFVDAYENGIFAFNNYPSQYPYRYGESIGSITFGLIPRSIWPNKPYGFSHWLSLERLGHEAVDAGNSLSTSFLGDLWAGGGLPNVFLASLAWGWLLAWVRNWQDTKPDMVRRVVYWEFLVVAMICQRGDMYTIFSRGVAIIAFSLIIARIARRRITPKAIASVRQGTAVAESRPNEPLSSPSVTREANSSDSRGGPP